MSSTMLPFRNTCTKYRARGDEDRPGPASPLELARPDKDLSRAPVGSGDSSDGYPVATMVVADGNEEDVGRDVCGGAGAWPREIRIHKAPRRAGKLMSRLADAT